MDMHILHAYWSQNLAVWDRMGVPWDTKLLLYQNAAQP